jgi:hypothetical protein
LESADDPLKGGLETALFRFVELSETVNRFGPDAIREWGDERRRAATRRG